MKKLRKGVKFIFMNGYKDIYEIASVDGNVCYCYDLSSKGKIRHSEHKNAGIATTIFNMSAEKLGHTFQIISNSEYKEMKRLQNMTIYDQLAETLGSVRL